MVPEAGRSRRLTGVNAIDDDVTSLSPLDDLVLYTVVSQKYIELNTAYSSFKWRLKYHDSEPDPVYG